LANGEIVTGTTVHVMEERFDTGDIIAQRHLTIKRKETTFSLFLRLCVLGSDVFAEAVTGLMKGTASLTPQDLSLYTYFSWPGRDTIRALFRNGHRLCSVHDVVEAIRYVK
jgi:methionyl-tRNA formyltransferase